MASLAFFIWALQALLNLLRSVGDALDDLIESMLKMHSLADSQKFFEDPSCVAQRFKERAVARKLTWVLLADPVTSATMYKALGGVLVSVALVFLPAVMAVFAAS